ncbi:PP2C family protein-serine/threonine phosphatase [Streptomyces litchfieldiae]|uniref:PP2C family protein-serine/threonine phosphatase n=1 Tax=Streptomyces litchfieldiae TaxID=3075543 RepID=A0ABU2MTZ5_9ACTN|nr:PP2C family protein-serine/threonine phosphatase [Streptomyces sp. DSM 44938]MDT0345112.1 PP2C family protein-serine/threonine phosphatase [Streptomyces sp. DSM 44938]
MHTSAPWRAGVWAYAWLPALLVAIGTWLDFQTPPHVTLTPFYVAAPLLAAPVLSLPITAAYGVLATGAVAAQMSWRIPEPAWSEATIKTGTVALISLLALVINRIVARRDQRVAAAQNVAEAVQRAVVPEPPDRAGGLTVAARYRAAQRNTLIGGDLYAVRETPHGVRILIGDVRGKGLAATEAVAVLLGAFREAADDEPRLESVTARMETALMRERRKRAALDAVEGFTTALLVEVPRDPPDCLRLINRGHPPPLLLGPGGAADYVPADPALPLGLGDLGPGPDRPCTAGFPPGSQLLLYTDGVSEARDADGVFYEPAASLAGRVFAGPAELADGVVEDVLEHTGGALADDMALLAVDRPATDTADSAANGSGPG